jgi:hypothetical protein
MQVEFRECDFFNLWLWLEFETAPSPMERQYIEEIFDSWFFLGKLGGFNAENLQVQETGLEISYMDYDNTSAGDSMLSLMHNMGDVEYEGTWARCWVDMGTSDAIAIDVLINAFSQFSREFIALKRLVVGGENPDWPVPNSGRPEFVSDDN